LEDDLTEVKNYMVVLLEFVYENQVPEIRQMIPPLTKIIRLMREVCPVEVFSINSSQYGTTPNQNGASHGSFTENKMSVTPYEDHALK